MQFRTAWIGAIGTLVHVGLLVLSSRQRISGLAAGAVKLTAAVEPASLNAALS